MASRWVILDFAGVVGKHQPEADKAAMVAAARAPAEPFWAAYWERRDEYDLASLSAEDYWTAVVRAATSRTPAGETIERLVTLDVASWLHPMPETLVLVEDLRRDGRGVALLSNAPLPLAEAVDDLPWAALPEPRFYSSRLGRTKPDPEVYATVADLLGTAPQRCVFVDDREVNVAGAASAGMEGIVFTGAARLRSRLLPSDSP